MNALVFLVLRSERELQAYLEQYKRYDDEVKPSQPASQHKQKTSKEFSYHLEPQKNCECCKQAS
jgi:hypothetical protein